MQSANPKVLPTVTSAISAPMGGNVSESVPSGSVRTAAPIDLTATANFGTGVTAKVVANSRISFTAHRPGEISGPAVEVRIRFTNNSSAAVSLANVVLNDQDAKATPLVQVDSSPAAPVSGSLAPGKSATGIYAFELPPSYHSPLTLSVSYTTAAPVVLFVGDAK